MKGIHCRRGRRCCVGCDAFPRRRASGTGTRFSEMVPDATVATRLGVTVSVPKYRTWYVSTRNILGPSLNHRL
jgi:hypothetical protein